MQAPWNPCSHHLSILKIDSTKKVYKKLQGAAASWATNVGNERGEILISESEGSEGLRPMALGLMQRYQHAAVVLYTEWAIQIPGKLCYHGPLP